MSHRVTILSDQEVNTQRPGVKMEASMDCSHYMGVGECKGLECWYIDVQAWSDAPVEDGIQKHIFLVYDRISLS